LLTALLLIAQAAYRVVQSFTKSNCNSLDGAQQHVKYIFVRPAYYYSKKI